MKMQIVKWADDLAIELPDAIVQRFDLKEGDTIDSEILEHIFGDPRNSREKP